MLVRLIYASRATAPITTETINGILLAARKHNPENGITGILAYGNDTFLQVLEGGRQQVNQLYGQLIRDERHSDVTLLDLSEIDCRQYANWSMGRGKLDRINLSLLLKYAATPAFDPYSMSGKAVACLVQELVASASFVSRD